MSAMPRKRPLAVKASPVAMGHNRPWHYGQDSVKRCRDALAFGSAPIDFTTSRAHSMKRSTTGLKFRFFNMTIATGHGGIGISIGSRFRKKRSALGVNTEAGMAAINRPLMLKKLRR